MKAQAAVYMTYPPTQYLVAESPEEVKKRWLTAGQAQLDDKAAVLELTVINGYYDPYPMMINPAYVTCVEAAQPLMVEYSEFKAREHLEGLEKEIVRGRAGFSSD